jgi:hypothetical protein
MKYLFLRILLVLTVTVPVYGIKETIAVVHYDAQGQPKKCNLYAENGVKTVYTPDRPALLSLQEKPLCIIDLRYGASRLKETQDKPTSIDFSQKDAIGEINCIYIKKYEANSFKTKVFTQKGVEIKRHNFESFKAWQENLPAFLDWHLVIHRKGSSPITVNEDMIHGARTSLIQHYIGEYFLRQNDPVDSGPSKRERAHDLLVYGLLHFAIGMQNERTIDAKKLFLSFFPQLLLCASYKVMHTLAHECGHGLAATMVKPGCWAALGIGTNFRPKGRLEDLLKYRSRPQVFFSPLKHFDPSVGIAVVDNRNMTTSQRVFINAAGPVIGMGFDLSLVIGFGLYANYHNGDSLSQAWYSLLKNPSCLIQLLPAVAIMSFFDNITQLLPSTDVLQVVTDGTRIAQELKIPKRTYKYFWGATAVLVPAALYALKLGRDYALSKAT